MTIEDIWGDEPGDPGIEEEWTIQLAASRDLYQDTDNYLGVADGATNGFDSGLDEAKAPDPPGSSISLYFPRPEWEHPLSDYFARDIRPSGLTGSIQTWYFEVLSTDAGTVDIQFDFMEVPDIPVLIEDMNQGTIQTLTTGDIYTFSIDANSPHPFTVSVGDTSAPVLTLGDSFHGPAILIAGDPYSLDWRVTGNFEVDSVKLLLSTDYGVTFDTMAELGAESHVEGLIPEIETNVLNGCVIKIIVKDVNGDILEGQSHYPLTIANRRLEHPYISGWQLWGVPAIPDHSEISGNLDDDFNDYKVLYNYINHGYTFSDALVESQGYWLGTIEEGMIDIQGTPVTEDYTISLEEGWNLVSNPLLLNVRIDSLLFTKDAEIKSYEDAVTEGWVNSVYGYVDSAGYQFPMDLFPWSGYWISALMPNVEMTFPIHKTPVVEPDKKSSTEPLVAFQATAGTIRHDILAIGTHDDATIDFDAAHDAVTPPLSPGKEYISLYVPHPDLDLILGNHFSRDIRSSLSSEDEYEEWTIELGSSEPEVRITWDLTAIPENMELGIDVHGNGIFEDMRKLESITLEPDQQFTVRMGTHVVGLSKSEIPMDFMLGNNYPNPFNPTTTINYGLPNTGHVSLTIFNLTGRKIRTLVNAEQSAGYKSVIWDGKNDAGEMVSTGIYFYRMVSEEFNQTKKMVYMK